MFNFILLLAFFSISRLVLYSLSFYEQQIDFVGIEFVKTIAYGGLNDLITCAYILAPVSILGLITPKIVKKSYLYYIVIVLLVFLVVAEFTFWLEFATRFNFIAVDYLVYTHEVVGNIIESYPVFIIFPAIFIIALIIYYCVRKRINMQSSFKAFAFYSIAAVLSFFLYNPKITDISDNNYLSELNKNGLYNLFSAFRHNSINYPDFYASVNQQKAVEDLAQYINGSKSIERYVKAKDKPNNYNVILIVVESLSEAFLHEDHSGPLTPEINALIPKGAYFSKIYAAGTRTVKGLEAITLAIPPLPGQSILRRANNANLFSLGSVLKKENYDLKFIYGGYGYFDNMNNFFSKNNFQAIDRDDMPKNEVEFGNIWGVSDQDLYKQAIKQADLSFAGSRKFFSLLMTTSNHRPYTYPKTSKVFEPNRYGGVKYSDYAIGEFIRNASKKPWFDNTIFVITADHCAGSAGKVALPPEKYHIPLLIYAPKIIKPQVIDKLSSQIDIAPTILSLLNISYKSKFFGNDIYSKTYENAFIATFQKLGYIQDQKLVALLPGKSIITYNIESDNSLKETKEDQTLIKRAIDYYQSAYYLYSEGLLKDE